MGFHFLSSCEKLYNSFQNWDLLLGHTDHWNENKNTFVYLPTYDGFVVFAGICLFLVKIDIFHYNITTVSIIQWSFTLQQKSSCINDGGIWYVLEINVSLPDLVCGKKFVQYSIFLVILGPALWIRFQFSKICKFGPLGVSELFKCLEL